MGRSSEPNPSSSSPTFSSPIKPPFTHYNSLHAPPPSCPLLSHHKPHLIRYPPLYVPTTDPFYTDRRHYVQILRVGKLNFEEEKNRIKHIIETTEFNVVSIDTEYPGTIYPANGFKDRHVAAQYRLMKANVDELSLIQVGLTLSDADGNLVTCGPSKHAVVWEFIISDFDLKTQPYNQGSVIMLFRRGIDFAFHNNQGISSVEFARMLRDAGLVRERHCHELGQGTSRSQSRSTTTLQNQRNAKNIRWITFHGAYDFGYFIKALTNSNLPNTLEEFLNLVQRYFGNDIYDVKYMLKVFCNNVDKERCKKLMGGLEAVARKISAWRVMGVGHQSGSDSLLTLMVFKQLKKLYDEDGLVQRASAGYVYPLA